MSTLTKEQLAHLQLLMGKRRAKVASDIARERDSATGKDVAAVARAAHDDGDEAAAAAAATLDRAQFARDVEELQDIEAARARIESKSYGICIDCGGDIHYQRLLAWPTAKRCYDCQYTHELRQRAMGAMG
jgi:RNA polymerase-binding transcription factor DksA